MSKEITLTVKDGEYEAELSDDGLEIRRMIYPRRSDDPKELRKYASFVQAVADAIEENRELQGK